MDSLTQIVLGAACGEAILGRKIGNRALLLGAIGGTIPDLDIFVAKILFTSELDQFLFHRGFMHSLFFNVIFAGILAFLSQRFLFRKHNISIMRWYAMWSLALVTHPILDAFTAYGTQLWLPFSDVRVGLNNISVVDLFYTLPFLLCLLMLMFFKRVSIWRKRILVLGLGISSFYMVWTFSNKNAVEKILAQTISKEHLQAERTFLQPTLFTNFLWYASVETQKGFYSGMYSTNDAKPLFKMQGFVPKNDALRKQYAHTKTLQKLEAFTMGFYNLHKGAGDTLRFSDLRYPLLDETQPEKGSVFGYNLLPDGKGDLEIVPFRPELEPDAMQKLIDRIFGI